MTFFVASDIHSFFNEFIAALKAKGYDENNKDHYLIVLGDYFDRGKQPVEVLNFFKNRERCILIKGNHEQLFLDALDRGYFLGHDYHNGTAETITIFKEQKKIKEVREFIGTLTPYFETKNYIFVHTWIPLNRNGEYYSNWRKASFVSWNQAMWNNPFLFGLSGLNKTGKTIVFGHWHTSWYRNKIDPEKDPNDPANFGIVENKEKKFIGIDACTAYTKKCNILVINDDFLEGTR